VIGRWRKGPEHVIVDHDMIRPQVKECAVISPQRCENCRWTTGVGCGNISASNDLIFERE
jgi:hypothetical protein